MNGEESDPQFRFHHADGRTLGKADFGFGFGSGSGVSLDGRILDDELGVLRGSSPGGDGSNGSGGSLTDNL